jgi:hypothetical protein
VAILFYFLFGSLVRLFEDAFMDIPMFAGSKVASSCALLGRRALLTGRGGLLASKSLKDRTDSLSSLIHSNGALTSHLPVPVGDINFVKFV